MTFPRLRHHLAAAGVYLLAALLITWPLVTKLTTEFTGFGYSDAYEMAHHIWWFKYALQTGNDLFYQSMLGYPNGIEGITLWAHPLQFFPAWLLAFVMPLPAAYNLSILLSLVLNGLALYWLALYLTRGQFGPALLAGLVYLAFPTMQGHLGAGHAGLMVQWPVPLFLYALFRLSERFSKRRFVLTALLFVMSTFGHTLQVIYVLLPVSALFLFRLTLRREWKRLARVVPALTLGAVALGLFLIPVARATLTSAAISEAGGAVRYSADLLAAVTPSFFHPLFGQLEYTHRVLGINIDEGYAYAGLVAGVLALLALWKMRAARWWAALGIVAYGLSLGPLLKLLDQPLRLHIAGYETFLPLPGALIDALPLLNLARTPGRFNFTLALAVAVLTAFALAYLWPRLGRARWPVAGILAGLMLFEYQAFWPLPTTPAFRPAAIEALAERDDIRAVFDVPWKNLVAAKQAIYLQTVHEQALVAGQVTRITPVDPAKLTLLQETLDPALLNEAGADLVIVHREYDDNGHLMARAREQLGDPIYRDDRLAVFEPPDPANPAQFTALPMQDEAVTDQTDAYVYAPATGWALFEATLEAQQRTATLQLDGIQIGTWTIDGEQNLRVPLPLEAGYHTISLQVDPPCPAAHDAALRCRAVALSDAAFGSLVEDDFRPVPFAGGVTLMGARPADVTDNRLAVWLWWRFDEPRNENEIRFVHLLNAAGELVAQVDTTLGEREAGEQLAEIVELALPHDLPPGLYRAYAGWYTYPDGARFPVLADVPGSESAYVLAGEITIPAR
ncbi:MAG: hypothetical protein DIU68_001480 [Chloroflexota bacterium]|nr:MAG: hypothetical protein DIU68_01195 [Chloroflexota bacterium]